MQTIAHFRGTGSSAYNLFGERSGLGHGRWMYHFGWFCGFSTRSRIQAIRAGQWFHCQRLFRLIGMGSGRVSVRQALLCLAQLLPIPRVVGFRRDGSREIEGIVVTGFFSVVVIRKRSLLWLMRVPWWWRPLFAWR